MRKFKIQKTFFFQLLVIAAFAAMAMSSSSSKDAADFMDGFHEGYGKARYGSDNNVKSDTITDIKTHEHVS